MAARANRRPNRPQASRDQAHRGWGDVIGRSGMFVGLGLVGAASALAFVLTSSTVARTELPRHLDIAVTTAATIPSMPTTVPPRTTTPTIATTSSSPVASTTSTSVPRATITSSTLPRATGVSGSGGSESTTVVTPIRPVHVEDDHGDSTDSEGVEAVSGTTDHENKGDR
ncbi:MAG TPA: hypothetical protein VNF07_10810 [Acidimicrobiales bacterium]|nr:hypothetical protein [Acidimicrobiales bacterium]